MVVRILELLAITAERKGILVGPVGDNNKTKGATTSASQETKGKIQSDLVETGDRMAGNRTIIGIAATNDSIATIHTKDCSAKTGDRIAIVTARTIGTHRRPIIDSKHHESAR